MSFQRSQNNLEQKKKKKEMFRILLKHAFTFCQQTTRKAELNMWIQKRITDKRTTLPLTLSQQLLTVISSFDST